MSSGAYGLGREHFLANGQMANIGKANFGMMWSAVVCLLFSAIMFCSAGAASLGPRRQIYEEEPDEEEG